MTSFIRGAPRPKKNPGSAPATTALYITQFITRYCIYFKDTLPISPYKQNTSNQFVWSERNPCEIAIVIIVLCFGNHLLKCIFKILENSLNDSKLDKQNSKCEPQEADSQKLWRSMIYIWVRTVYLNLTITVNGLLLISIFYYILPPSTSCLHLHQSRKE